MKRHYGPLSWRQIEKSSAAERLPFLALLREAQADGVFQPGIQPGEPARVEARRPRILDLARIRVRSLVGFGRPVPAA